MNIPTVKQGKRLLLALSGGVDSMVMLDLLFKQHRYELFAVTVNHNIRPEGASDAEFTAHRCKEYGIPCFTESIDVPAYADKNGLSIETAARILRHAAIKKHAKNADLICYAHHADDQTETVLMHMLRGCGTDGLNGMSVLTDRVFRPLLHLTKAQIREYAQENGIAYVEDNTNSDTDYKRNFIRHKVVPILNECYGGASKAICMLAERTSIDTDYLKEQAKSFKLFVDLGEGFVPLTDDSSLKEKAISVKADAKALSSLHRAISVRVIMRMLWLIGAAIDTEQKHIASVLSLASNTGGKRLDLHGGATAYTTFGDLVLTKERYCLTGNDEQLPFKELLEKGSVVMGEYEISVSRYRPVESSELKLLKADISRIPKDCVIRTRHEGDRFRKFGGATKKLKDFFIERKLPQPVRNRIPLIAKGESIYVVCGTEISEELRITEKTTDNNIYYIITKLRRITK